MGDTDVMGPIQKLARAAGISEDERARLGEIEVKLDQCWDFPRQRRALSSSGGDPDQASVRDAGTVERYLS